MKEIVYWDGQFLDAQHVFVPIHDRGFLYGEGVFTTIQVRDGIPLHVGRHFKRLQKQCESLTLAFPPLNERDLGDLIVLNHAQREIWRLKIIVTKEHALMTLRPEISKAGVPCSLSIYPYPYASPTAKIKSLAYLDRLLFKKYAEMQGTEDAVLIDPEGAWLETAHANLFWKEGQTIYIPDPALPYLSGIALECVLEATQELGLSCTFVSSQPSPQAQIYICNALHDIRPVTHVGGEEKVRDLDFERDLQISYRNIR